MREKNTYPLTNKLVYQASAVGVMMASAGIFGSLMLNVVIQNMFLAFSMSFLWSAICGYYTKPVAMWVIFGSEVAKKIENDGKS